MIVFCEIKKLNLYKIFLRQKFNFIAYKMDSKNNYKIFIRNVEEKMKLIISEFFTKELLIHLVIFDSSNNSIKY